MLTIGHTGRGRGLTFGRHGLTITPTRTFVRSKRSASWIGHRWILIIAL